MDALRRLGLYDDVHRLFRRSGMAKLLDKSDFTYRCLVMEFLVTVRCSKDKFKFRLLNEKYTMTCDEMSLAFGCTPVPPEPTLVELSAEQCAHFWLDVTRVRLPTAGGYFRSIRHPVLRIAQRILAMPFMVKRIVRRFRI